MIWDYALLCASQFNTSHLFLFPLFWPVLGTPKHRFSGTSFLNVGSIFIVLHFKYFFSTGCIKIHSTMLTQTGDICSGNVSVARHQFRGFESQLRCELCVWLNKRLNGVRCRTTYHGNVTNSITWELSDFLWVKVLFLPSICFFLQKFGVHYSRVFPDACTCSLYTELLYQ